MIVYLLASENVDSFVKRLTANEVIMTDKYLEAMAFADEFVAKKVCRGLPLHHLFHVHPAGVPEDHPVITKDTVFPAFIRATSGPYKGTPDDEVAGI